MCNVLVYSETTFALLELRYSCKYDFFHRCEYNGVKCSTHKCVFHPKYMHCADCLPLLKGQCTIMVIIYN